MWKSFGGSFLALVIIYFAGIITQSYGFGVGIVALFSISCGLMGYAFTSHTKWCDDKNYLDRVLCELVSDRVCAVFDRGTIGKDSVSFLYDAIVKKTVVYHGPFTSKGFHEVEMDRKIYLVPDGKQLVFGNKDEVICVHPV